MNGSHDQPTRATVPRGRRSAARRRLPEVEALEARRLLSLTFQFAGAIAASPTGSVDVQSSAVAVDSSGNVFVTGSVQGTADFDPGPGTVNLTSTGGRDVFLAKYGPTGALVWAKAMRGADSASVGQGAAVAVDPAGNVYLSGTVTGTVNFSPPGRDSQLPPVPEGAVVSAPGRNDVFVAKYDNGGNLVWARDVAGTAGSADTGYALAADASGNVAVAGAFQNTATFGGQTLTAGGSFDAFVAELDASGRFVWARSTRGSGPSSAQAAGVTFDGGGNVVATGFFSGAVDFDPGPAVLNLPYAGSRDAFVQKLDGAGNLVWARSAGGSDTDQGNSVAADGAGNLYVAGTFAATAAFDRGAGAARSTLGAGGYLDGFLWKLDPSGQFAWVDDMAAGGTGTAQATGVALDASGRVFVAGYYSGALGLDPAAPGVTFTSAGGYDLFLGEYDASGGFRGGQSAGGPGFDTGFGIGVNGAGLVATAGRFSGPAAFGPFGLPAQPGKAVFVAALTSSTASAPPAPGAPALQAASDTGASASDRLTNATTLVFDVTGVSASGNRVDLLRDGLVVASRTGPGALTDPGPLADGVYVYTARQADGTNQVGPTGAGTSVTVVTRTPAAPAAPALMAADDSGAKGDGVTNVRRPRLAGATDPNVAVQLLDPSGNVVTATTAAADGSYTLAPPVPLADGPASFRVRKVDAAGNLGAASAAVNLVIATAVSPTPGAPALLAADDSGAAGDGVTNVRAPRLVGAAAAGSTVQLLNAAGAAVGSAVAGASGTYTVAVAAPLADGAYDLRVQVVDVAGNVSAAGAAFRLTVLAAIPATPPAPALLPADDSGVAGDNLTNVRQPRLTGTAPVGYTVQVVGPNGDVLGTAVAGPAGGYTVAVSTPAADGAYPLRVWVTDRAGNVSAAGPPLTLTIDTTPPATPAVPSLPEADDSGAVGDGLTRVTRPRLTGTAEAGATVRLLDASGAVLGVATAAANGAYAVAPTAPLVDGAYALRVRAVDAAGNPGGASGTFTLTVDTTPPAAPAALSLVAADDSGAKGDGLTNVRTPRLTGTAEPGITVQLMGNSGVLLGTSRAAADGTFTLTPSVALTDGSYVLYAAAVDAAGNVGPPGGALTLAILGTPPPAPASLGLATADDSGVKGDGVTNVNPPRLTGTAAPGTTVQVVNAAGVTVGTAAVAADGSFAVLPSGPFAEGSTTLQARAVDAAGNVSPPGPAFVLAVLTTPPAAPPGPTLAAADDTGTAGDGRTAVRRPRLTGTVGAGLAVELIDTSGLVVGSAVASTANGAYSVPPATGLPVGANVWRVRARDAAGNVSPASAPVTVTVVGATAGDHDGDGRTDLTVFRPATAAWTSQGSAGAKLAASFGAANLFDIPAPGDYDGVGRAELAVFRPSTGQWLIQSPGGLRVVSFGATNLFDIPAPGDYDGDGKAEPAVFRPSTGQWLIQSPTGLQVMAFGATNLTDLPTQASIGSLVKLGRVGGAVTPARSTAALSVSAAETTAPSPVAPAAWAAPGPAGEAELAAALDGVSAARRLARRRLLTASRGTA